MICYKKCYGHEFIDRQMLVTVDEDTGEFELHTPDTLDLENAFYVSWAQGPIGIGYYYKG